MATKKSSAKAPDSAKTSKATAEAGAPPAPANTVTLTVGNAELELAEVKAQGFKTLLYVNLQALDAAQLAVLDAFIQQMQLSPIVICETLGLPPPKTKKKNKKKPGPKP